MRRRNFLVKRGVVFAVISLLIGALAVPERVLATPSTTYWSPCTMDIQPFGIWHLTYDSYTTMARKLNNRGGDFPTDLGLTVGVLPFEKLQLEVGIDLVEPTDYPVFFNAKLGTPENAWFKGSPALNLGIFNVGTSKGLTAQNAVDVIVGKSLPFVGRLHAGYYFANSSVLKDANGGEENDGFMIGWDRWLIPDKLMIAADYMSGDNVLGGGGVGLYFYFTKNISLLVGPVWYKDENLNGETKFTFQLDINTDISTAKSFLKNWVGKIS